MSLAFYKIHTACIFSNTTCRDLCIYEMMIQYYVCQRGMKGSCPCKESCWTHPLVRTCMWFPGRFGSSLQKPRMHYRMYSSDQENSSIEVAKMITRRIVQAEDWRDIRKSLEAFESEVNVRHLTTAMYFLTKKNVCMCVCVCMIGVCMGLMCINWNPSLCRNID